MRTRSTVLAGLATLLMLVLAPLALGSALSGSAGAYPVTTCSTLAVSTTNPIAGAAITVSGTGFTPNAVVTLQLRPGNSTLAAPRASASGAFSAQVTLPASTTNNGHYFIYAITGAVSSSSCPVDPSQSLDIQAASSGGGGATNGGGGSTGGLSSTGVDIAGLVALAAVLLGAGVVLNRRRSRVDAH